MERLDAIGVDILPLEAALGMRKRVRDGWRPNGKEDENGVINIV